MYIAFHDGEYLGFADKPVYCDGKWLTLPNCKSASLNGTIGSRLYPPGHACKFTVEEPVNCTKRIIMAYLRHKDKRYSLDIMGCIFMLVNGEDVPMIPHNTMCRVSITSRGIELIGALEALTP